jgi:hypothetical protein
MAKRIIEVELRRNTHRGGGSSGMGCLSAMMVSLLMFLGTVVFVLFISMVAR